MMILTRDLASTRHRRADASHQVSLGQRRTLTRRRTRSAVTFFIVAPKSANASLAQFLKGFKTCCHFYLYRFPVADFGYELRR
jgi:hypothetical protein